jgi:hypothetical protein
MAPVVHGDACAPCELLRGSLRPPSPPWAHRCAVCEPIACTEVCLFEGASYPCLPPSTCDTLRAMEQGGVYVDTP